MFTGLVSSLLESILKPYIKDLDPSKLDIGGGSLTLKNLVIKEDAFDYLQLPFILLFGCIGNIKIRISWSQITSKPVRIDIKDLLFIIKLRTKDDKLNEDAILEQELKSKLRALDVWELLRFPQSDEEKDKSFTTSLLQTIINNLQVNVEQVHIRWEHHHSNNTKKKINVGAVIRQMSISPTSNKDFRLLNSIPAKGKQKWFELNSFGIYINNNQQSGLNNTALMLDVFDDQPKYDGWDFIIPPVIMELVMITQEQDIEVLAKALDEPKTKFLISIHSLGCIINQLQYHSLCTLAASLTNIPSSNIKLLHDEPSEMEKVEYIQLYRLKFQGYEPITDVIKNRIIEMEEIFRFGEVIHLRQIAIEVASRELNISDDAVLMKRKKKSRGFFFSWFGSSSQSANEIVDYKKLPNDEILALLHRNDLDTIEVKMELPEEYVLQEMMIHLETGFISFIESNDMPWIDGKVNQFYVQYSQRSNGNAIKININAVNLRDQNDINTMYPYIITSKLFNETGNGDNRNDDKTREEKKSKYFVELIIDSNPLLLDVDRHINLILRNSTIIFHPQLLQKFTVFFTLPEDKMDDNLKTLAIKAKERFENFRNTSKHILMDALDSRPRIGLNLSLKAPTLIFPNLMCNSSNTTVFADLGSLNIKNVLQTRQQLEDAKTRIAQNDLNIDKFKPGDIIHFYDVYDIKLTSTSMWYDVEDDIDTRVFIMKPCAFQLLCKTSIASNLTKFGIVPLEIEMKSTNPITIYISPRRLFLIKKLIQSLSPSSNSDNNNSDSNNNVNNSNNNDTNVVEYDEKDAISDNINNNDNKTKDNQNIKDEANHVLSRFSFNMNEAILKFENDINIDNISKVLNFGFKNVNFVYTNNTFDRSLELVAKHWMIKDCGVDRYLLQNQGNSGVILNIYWIDTGSPLLKTHNADLYIALNTEKVILNISKQTLYNIIDFFSTDLYAIEEKENVHNKDKNNDDDIVRKLPDDSKSSVACLSLHELRNQHNNTCVNLLLKQAQVNFYQDEINFFRVQSNCTFDYYSVNEFSGYSLCFKYVDGGVPTLLNDSNLIDSNSNKIKQSTFKLEYTSRNSFTSKIDMKYVSFNEVYALLYPTFETEANSTFFISMNNIAIMLYPRTITQLKGFFSRPSQESNSSSIRTPNNNRYDNYNYNSNKGIELLDDNQHIYTPPSYTQYNINLNEVRIKLYQIETNENVIDLYLDEFGWQTILGSYADCLFMDNELKENNESGLLITPTNGNINQNNLDTPKTARSYHSRSTSRSSVEEFFDVMGHYPTMYIISIYSVKNIWLQLNPPKYVKNCNVCQWKLSDIDIKYANKVDLPPNNEESKEEKNDENEFDWTIDIHTGNIQFNLMAFQYLTIQSILNSMNFSENNNKSASLNENAKVNTTTSQTNTSYMLRCIATDAIITYGTEIPGNLSINSGIVLTYASKHDAEYALAGELLEFRCLQGDNIIIQPFSCQFAVECDPSYLFSVYQRRDSTINNGCIRFRGVIEPIIARFGVSTLYWFWFVYKELSDINQRINDDDENIKPLLTRAVSYQWPSNQVNNEYPSLTECKIQSLSDGIANVDHRNWYNKDENNNNHDNDINNNLRLSLYSERDIQLSVDTISVEIIDNVASIIKPILLMSLSRTRSEWKSFACKESISLTSLLQLQYYNSELSIWEPGIEPWLARFYVERYRSRLFDKPVTSTLITGLNELNINISSVLFDILYDVKHRIEEDIQHIEKLSGVLLELEDDWWNHYFINCSEIDLNIYLQLNFDDIEPHLKDLYDKELKRLYTNMDKQTNSEAIEPFEEKYLKFTQTIEYKAFRNALKLWNTDAETNWEFNQYIRSGSKAIIIENERLGFKTRLILNQVSSIECIINNTKVIVEVTKSIIHGLAIRIRTNCKLVNETCVELLINNVKPLTIQPKKHQWLPISLRKRKTLSLRPISSNKIRIPIVGIMPTFDFVDANISEEEEKLNDSDVKEDNETSLLCYDNMSSYNKTSLLCYNGDIPFWLAVYDTYNNKLDTRTISFCSPLIIENVLPCTIVLSISSKNENMQEPLRLASGTHISIHTIDTTKDMFIGIMLLSILPKWSKLETLRYNNEIMELVFEISNIRVLAEVKMLNNTLKIIFYAPYWLYDFTKLSLIVADTLDVSNHNGIEVGTRADETEAIPFTPSHATLAKLRSMPEISVKMSKQKQWSSTFTLPAIGSNDIFILKSNDNNVIDLSVTVQQLSGIYSKTRSVKFARRYLVVNQIDCNTQIRVNSNKDESSWISLKSGESSPLLFPYNSNQRSISARFNLLQYQTFTEWTGIVNIQDTGDYQISSFYRGVAYIIRVQVQIINSVVFVLLSAGINIAPPLRIENHTSFATLHISQIKSIHWQSLQPFTCVSYAFDNPHDPQSIRFRVSTNTMMKAEKDEYTIVPLQLVHHHQMIYLNDINNERNQWILYISVNNIGATQIVTINDFPFQNAYSHQNEIELSIDINKRYMIYRAYEYLNDYARQQEIKVDELRNVNIKNNTFENESIQAPLWLSIVDANISDDTFWLESIYLTFEFGNTTHNFNINELPNHIPIQLSRPDFNDVQKLPTDKFMSIKLVKKRTLRSENILAELVFSQRQIGELFTVTGMWSMDSWFSLNTLSSSCIALLKLRWSWRDRSFSLREAVLHNACENLVEYTSSLDTLKQMCGINSFTAEYSKWQDEKPKLQQEQQQQQQRACRQCECMGLSITHNRINVPLAQEQKFTDDITRQSETKVDKLLLILADIKLEFGAALSEVMSLSVQTVANKKRNSRLFCIIECGTFLATVVTHEDTPQEILASKLSDDNGSFHFDVPPYLFSSKKTELKIHVYFHQDSPEYIKYYEETRLASYLPSQSAIRVPWLRSAEKSSYFYLGCTSILLKDIPISNSTTYFSTNENEANQLKDGKWLNINNGEATPLLKHGAILLSLQRFQATKNKIAHLDFNIIIPVIGICGIDSIPASLFYLSLQNINLQLQKSNSIKSVDFSVTGIQFDNQHYDSIYPVVFRSLSVNKNLKALNFRMNQIVTPSEYPVNMYSYMSLRLEEFELNVEEAFIYKLLKFINQLSDNKIYLNETIETLGDPKIDDDTELSMHPYLSYMHDIYKSPKEFSRMIFINHFEISNIFVVFSFRPSITERQKYRQIGFNPLQYVLEVAGAIEKASLKASALTIENARGSLGTLVNPILRHLMFEGLQQFYKVLGSADFLGNPIELMSNLGTGVRDFVVEPASALTESPQAFGLGLAKGTNSLLRNTASGFLTSATNITQSAGTGLSLLTFDDKFIEQRKIHQNSTSQGLLRGVETFGKSAWSGISGVVVNPITGAKQDGVSGFLKGISTGLIGVVAKPIVGFVDMGTSALKGVNLRVQLKKKLLNRFRFPRFISPIEGMMIYDAEAAYGQWLIKHLKKPLPDEYYLMHIKFETGILVISTFHMIYELNIEDETINNSRDDIKGFVAPLKNVNAIVDQGRYICVQINEKISIEDKIIDANNLELGHATSDILKQVLNRIKFLHNTQGSANLSSITK